MGLKEKSEIRRGGELFKEKGSRPTGIHGNLSEKRILKGLGIKQTPASGAMAHSKGDGVDLNFRVECKATKAGSMSLQLDWLQKISNEATETGLRPALTISFVDESGNQQKNGDWVMMRRVDFEEILEKINAICEGL